jgi:hypothetical protein
MYTGKENRDTIMSFLYGYEIGRSGQCEFIEKLSKSIAQEYGIEKLATGCWGQIEMTARELETDWVTIFKKQSIKVLTTEFSDLIDEELILSFKKRIVGKTGRVNNHFRKYWITDWFGIIDLSADWFKKMWTKRELEMITNIEEELKTFGKVRKLKENLNPTDKLKLLCRELYEEMEKYE